MVIYENSPGAYEHAESQINILTDDEWDCLYNSGCAPRYQNTDKVDSDFFKPEKNKEDSTHVVNIYWVMVPPKIPDIESWLLEKICKLGYKGWDDILPHLSLPADKATVLENRKPHFAAEDLNEWELVRHAVILSKCSSVGYDPQSSMIFSKKRIHRSANLISINLKSFYELD